MENKHAPAFPIQPTFDDQGRSRERRYGYEGLTKREYFAAIAMQSIVMAYPDTTYEDAARMAIKHADEILKQLES